MPAFDAYSESAANTDPADYTHTPVGTPRGVVILEIQTNTANEVSGVAYGALGLTEVSGSPVTEATEGIQVRGWFAGSGIPTGAQTVSFTITGTTGTKLFYVITLTGSGDLELVDVKTLASAAVVDPTVTLALSSRTSWCGLAGMSGHGAVGSVTPFTGWTTRDETTTGTELGLCYTQDTPGATDVSAGWTQISEDAALIALAVSEVVAAAGFGQLLSHDRNHLVVGM